jgi:multidrug resistance efflux pump
MTMKHSAFNWYYPFIGILFVGMLYVSGRYFKGSKSSSVGIASSKEYKINAEKASIVQDVFVVAGQQVKKGDLLATLTSTALDIDIEKLTDKLEVMRGEQQVKAKNVESKIAYIRADEGVVDEELESEISQTTSEVELNRKLTKAFVKDSITEDDSKSPLQVKIKSLREQQRKHQLAVDIKVSDLLKDHQLDQTQLINQIRLSERELSLLQEEKKKLSKYAMNDGVIGNVYIKTGEQVNAFTPLLSVTPLQPTTVIAYLVGPKTSTFQVGSSVLVIAYGIQSPVDVPGKVIGYGSVTELPDILQKSTAVKAFGREVFIEISGDNQFANGQKVLVK